MMAGGEKSATLSPRTTRIVLWLLVGFALLWYATLPSEVFYGDDARLLVDAQNGTYAGSFPAGLFQVFAEKYRPVFSGLFALLWPLFGNDHHAYELLNDVILAVCAGLIFRIALTLSLDLVVSVACTILFIISRFVYYAQSQVWGTMECVATLLLLLLVRETLQYLSAPSTANRVRILLWFTLLVFTHERFLALALPLTALFLFRKERVALWVLPLVIAGFNFIVKTLFFRVQFFEGQGGSALQVAPASVLVQTLQLVASLAGISVIKQFWTGLSFDQMPLGMQLSGAGFAALLIGGAGYAIWRNRAALSSNRGPLAIGALAALSIIATAVVLTGLQARMAYAPYVCLVIAIAYVFGRRVIPGRAAALFAVGLVICGTALDAPFRYYSKFGYLEYYAILATDAKALIIDRGISSTRHVVVISSDRTLANFVLNPWFFHIYAPEADFDVSFADQPPVFDVDGPQRKDTRYLTVAEGRLVDVTGDMFAHALAGLAFRARPLAGFTCHDPTIPTPVSTPQAPSSWPGQFEPLTGIVLNPNVVCLSAPMLVHDNDVLAFVGGLQPVPSQTTAALLRVDAVDGNSVEPLVVSEPVAPRDGIRWQAVAVPMMRFTGKTIRIQFTNGVPAGSIFPAVLLIGRPVIGAIPSVH
jgi:hypothetical protein